MFHSTGLGECSLTFPHLPCGDVRYRILAALWVHKEQIHELCCLFPHIPREKVGRYALDLTVRDCDLQRKLARKKQ
ncbi:hypothetical protein Ddc_18777 [Ditylenchus destructor]|nr:hypothetical protein Ddc_18777 [Ditylenchus destructor]